jgi:acyl-coenzyme A thioesterase PaaI-like protein
MTAHEALGADFGWQVGDETGTARVTDATRILIGAIRRGDAPTETLERVAALIDEAAALLVPHRIERTPAQSRSRTNPFDHAGTPLDPQWVFPYSPVIGNLNPIAPPCTFSFDGERMHGTAHLEAPYNGPPGMVHGGIIALIFDELLGSTAMCLDVAGFTGTLSIRYERPTPIDTDLVLEAVCDRTEGRKTFVTGTISHDGQVTARAEGIFIQAMLPFAAG